MTAVDASRVTDAVIATLRAATGLLVGDGVMPTPDDADDVLALSQGVLIVTQVQPTGIPSPTPYFSTGWAGESESMTRCRFRICAVGVQRNQAERAAERAANALVARDPGSHAWVHDLDVTGHTVIDRRRSGRLALEVDGGTFEAGAFVDVIVHATD